MSKQYYSEIFRHSGASYHNAMQLVPAAREEEFIAAVELLNLSTNSTVLDVPAGGGYLKPYLFKENRYIGRDFSMGFVESSMVNLCTETDLQAPHNSIDNIICLAALHHIEDPTGFFNAAHKALNHKGVFLIGDVIEGSRQDSFLNQFVNQWNSLGHQGVFINETNVTNKLIKSGFDTDYLIKDYRWNFDSIAQARQYVRLLFNLDKHPCDETLDTALNELGIEVRQDSAHINWSLGFFRAIKN